MSECAVIRCSRPAAAVRIMSLPDTVLLEEVVCAEHNAAMDAGEPWYWNAKDDRGVIYMGSDLQAEGVRILSDMGFSGSMDRASGINERHTRFTISHTDLAGSDEQRLDLLLTGPQARELAEWLERWGPGGE